MKGIEDLLEADPTIKLYSSLSPAARLTNRARTPVLPEAALVGALSALHRLANHEAGGIAARTTSSARSVTPAYRPLLRKVRLADRRAADEPWKEVSDDQDWCIRHYGFLAKGDRGETLARVHDLLQVQPTREPNAAREPKADEHARDPSTVCPDCGGLMRRIGDVAQSPAAAFRCDTS